MPDGKLTSSANNNSNNNNNNNAEHRESEDFRHSSVPGVKMACITRLRVQLDKGNTNFSIHTKT